MTGYKRVNYYELCRLCTSSQPKDKIHIFRDEGRKMQLQQKIQTCFPLLVCEHDYLPKVVCTTCIEALEQCYNFRQNCINSESMLSSYFSNFRFTDDFKKAGKVYVKDSGQAKLEVLPQNNLKKTIPDGIITNQNILQDGTQQFYNLELPNIPNKLPSYTKIPQNTSNVKETSQIQFTTLTTTPNYNNTTPQPIINNKLNNIDTNTDLNIIKSNLIQPQALMYIDIEQLVESGLPEQKIHKLKEVLLKPVDYNKNKNDDNILNNLNNNQIKNDSIEIKHFKCDSCEKVFKRREHLYQHSKLHTGIRPFNCIHCPKTFSRKEHLIRHLTSHSGVKDFSCDVCNKKFSRPDNLKKHKKTHQKSGPFICEVCSKSFVIKHYYLAHKLQHHEDLNASLKNDC